MENNGASQPAPHHGIASETSPISMPARCSPGEVTSVVERERRLTYNRSEMANRDRAAEILEIKSRGQQHAAGLHYELRSLAKSWNDFPPKDSPTAAFFPIRAVTLIEVFTRAWIATFVDFGKPYVERAITFTKNVKLDYDLVREIQGRTITLGDIIGHSLSLNTFGQVAGAFETLIEEHFVPRIAKAVDRWEVEVEGKAPVPIVSDAEAMSAALDRLFRVRHILVHEYPRRPVYALEDVAAMLGAAADFALAAHEACTEILYGKVPLTNMEMKGAAGEEWHRLDEELSRVIGQVSAREDDEGRKLLSDAQARWISYREAQCAFRADSTRGGTMAGLLWLHEARALTEARLKELRSYLEREEGDL